MEERGHLHPLKDETASAPLSCRLLFSLDHTINDNNMHTTQLLLDVKVRRRGSMQSMPKTAPRLLNQMRILSFRGFYRLV